jgi:23S rRNA maturation mini-RNase III
MATGFEALIGYLYLSEAHDRLDELMSLIIKIVEEGLL